jgi:hypothetical protein
MTDENKTGALPPEVEDRLQGFRPASQEAPKLPEHLPKPFLAFSIGVPPIPDFLLKPEPKAVPELLRAAAQTFEDRNAVYGSNYKMVGPMVKILFPDGVPSELVTSDRWHLFELMLVKISRFAISNLTHKDSIHDTTVYAAMVESLLGEEA